MNRSSIQNLKCFWILTVVIVLGACGERNNSEVKSDGSAGTPLGKLGLVVTSSNITYDNSCGEGVSGARINFTEVGVDSPRQFYARQCYLHKRLDVAPEKQPSPSQQIETKETPHSSWKEYCEGLASGTVPIAVYKEVDNAKENRLNPKYVCDFDAEKVKSVRIVKPYAKDGEIPFDPSTLKYFPDLRVLSVLSDQVINPDKIQLPLTTTLLSIEIGKSTDIPNLAKNLKQMAPNLSSVFRLDVLRDKDFHDINTEMDMEFVSYMSGLKMIVTKVKPKSLKPFSDNKGLEYVEIATSQVIQTEFLDFSHLKAFRYELDRANYISWDDIIEIEVKSFEFLR